MRTALTILAFLAAPCLSSAARAHAPSTAYLTVRPGGGESFTGRWDIAVRDLAHVFGVDGGDGSVSWGELRARSPELERAAGAALGIASGGGVCSTNFSTQGIVQRGGEAHLALALTGSCPKPMNSLTFDYRLFAADDPQHRGILRLDDGSDRTLALHGGGGRQTVTLGVRPGAWSAFASYVPQGAVHIWEGIDHILFLLALLLPAVLWRGPEGWTVVPNFRVALVDVLRVVTAFTAAHSLTLVLSTLDVIRVPGSIVEPAIAASVILAAVNNVYPVFGRDRWVVAFALGLLHGFGFSSVLAEVGLPPSGVAAALAGFNVGVELGQVVVVAAFVPVAYLLRGTVLYRRVALVGGSVAIAAVAALWLFERITEM